MGTDDNQQLRTAGALIPVEQDTVPFYGHDLVAVVLPDGRICAVLRWLCDGLKLNLQSQLRHIRGRTALADGLVSVRVDTDGGPQTMSALILDVLPGWLFAVDERRVKPDAQPDIILFQRECVQALAAYFEHKRRGILPSPLQPQSLAQSNPQLAGRVAQIAEQIGTLSGVISLMQEHMAGLLALPNQVAGIDEKLGQALTLLEALGQRQADTDSQLARIDERTQRLTPAHARAIQERVDQIVRETRRLPTPLTYAIIYGRLKHRFRANSYREIADEQYERVLAYLGEEMQGALSGAAPQQERLF